MKTIEITVDPQGRTRVEKKGFTGVSCRDASRFVEEALGQKSAEQVTASFYVTQEARQDRVPTRFLRKYTVSWHCGLCGAP